MEHFNGQGQRRNFGSWTHEEVQEPKEPEPRQEKPVKAHTRKPKRTIDELTEGLPVEKIFLDVPEEERVCSTCGSKLKLIGEKLVRWELETIPKQVKVIAYYTRVYACPACEKRYAGQLGKRDFQDLVQAAVPADTAVSA